MEYTQVGGTRLTVCIENKTYECHLKAYPRVIYYINVSIR